MPRRSRLLLAAVIALVVGVAAYIAFRPSASTATAIEMRPEPPEASTEEVHRLCAACHAYPSPDSFPARPGGRRIKRGYDFFHKDLTYRFPYPPLDAVVRYYEARAPSNSLRWRGRRHDPHAWISTASDIGFPKPACRESRTSISFTSSTRTRLTFSSAMP